MGSSHTTNPPTPKTQPQALVARAADPAAPATITGPAQAALVALMASGNPGKGGGGSVQGGAGAARLRRDAAQLLAGAISASRCRCSPALLAPLLAVDLASLTMAPSPPKDGGKAGGTAGPARPVGKKAALRAALAARGPGRRPRRRRES